MRDVCGHWRNGVLPIRRQPRSNNLQRPWWQLTGAREAQKQREFEPDGVQPSKAALALCHETQGSQNAPLLKRGGDAAHKRAGAVALENGRPIDYPPNVGSNPWLQLLSSIGCSQYCGCELFRLRPCLPFALYNAAPANQTRRCPMRIRLVVAALLMSLAWGPYSLAAEDAKKTVEDTGKKAAKETKKTGKSAAKGT